MCDWWPMIEPYETGRLSVREPHDLYWEQVGVPDGVPVLFLHGGPGAGCTETDRRFFDPDHFRVVLFDQRACGRSTPCGELSHNTIDDLVSDIEALRESLGIETWHVFGGSWGSTLSLYYAQEHPEVVRSLVLRGIWLLRSEEIDFWLYASRFVFPETWEKFANHVDPDERDDLLRAYHRRLAAADPAVAAEAARHWASYEAALCTLLPNAESAARFDAPELARSVALLEMHYITTGRFEPDDLLLQRVDRLRQIPAFIVHGRYDMVCAVKNAFDLSEEWPEASLVIVPDAGHSSHEPGIRAELLAAMNRVRDTGSPVVA